MLSKSITLKSFKKQKIKKIVNEKFEEIISNRNELIESLSKNYVDKYKINKIKKIVGKRNIRLIGMGGSILGSQAIYNFLEHKIKKNFVFVDNLVSKKNKDKSKNINLIVSKSGNTLEAIVNTNFF